MIRLLVLLLPIVMLLLLNTILRASSLSIFFGRMVMLSSLISSLLPGSLLSFLFFLVMLSLIRQLDLLLLSSHFSLLPIDKDIADLFGELEVDHVVFNESLDSVTAVVDLR